MLAANLPADSENYIDAIFTPGTYLYRVPATGSGRPTIFAGPVEASVQPQNPMFSRGPSNADGATDISDAVATLGFLFLGAKPPSCLDAADSNDSGVVDISDAVYSLQFLLIDGPAPEPSFPECGIDPAIDDLDCQSYPGCQ